MSVVAELKLQAHALTEITLPLILLVRGTNAQTSRYHCVHLHNSLAMIHATTLVNGTTRQTGMLIVTAAFVLKAAIFSNAIRPPLIRSYQSLPLNYRARFRSILPFRFLNLITATKD